MKPAAVFTSVAGVFALCGYFCAVKFYQWHHWPKPKGTPGIMEWVLGCGAEAIAWTTVAVVCALWASAERPPETVHEQRLRIRAQQEAADITPEKAAAALNDLAEREVECLKCHTLIPQGPIEPIGASAEREER